MAVAKKEARIKVRVYPSASRNGVVGFVDGVLGVKVSAPPVKGKANKELIVLLSQVLGVDKSQVSIIAGQASRNKVIAVRGLSQEEIMKRLSSFGADASR